MSPFKKPKANQALIRSGIGGSKVSTKSTLIVLPILHQVEAMDLSEHHIKIKRNKEWALLSADQVKIYGEVTFSFCVLNESLNLGKIVMTIGAENTFNQTFWEKLLVPKFNEAVEVLIAQHDIKTIFSRNTDWKEKLSAYLYPEFMDIRFTSIKMNLQRPKSSQLISNK